MDIQERPTGKLIMIVLNGEILSVSSHEGVTEIKSEESEIYINTKDKLMQLCIFLGINDTTKLEGF